MTRRFLLSSTALAALLATGGTAAPFTPSAARARPRTEAAPAPVAVATLELAGRLLAVVLPERLPADGAMTVAIQGDPDASMPDPVQMWIGRKNAWGSAVAVARPDTGLAGFATASVAIPAPLPPDARLWLGVARADGVLERGSLPLPA